MRRKNQIRAGLLFSCCFLMAVRIFGAQTGRVPLDSLSPVALGEEKYQELKRKGLILQPEQAAPPSDLKPENQIGSEKIEHGRGVLMPSGNVYDAHTPADEQVVQDQETNSPASGTTPMADTKCGTGAAVEALRRKAPPAVRPVLSGPEQTITTAHFVVHYTTSGVDATSATYANNVANYAEQSWTVQVTNLGWEAPPGDGAIGGGTNLYDIYIRDIGPLGVTNPESPGPDTRQEEYTSFIEIDIGLGTGLLQVTVAHEINHACQFSYSGFEQIWWYENTATWMEDQVYDGVNDYLTYLSQDPSPLTSPERPITHTVGSYEYGGAIWAMFLHEAYSINLPRRAWERMGTNFGEHTLADLDAALRDFGQNLADALRLYGIWRYFTGARADAYHYSEGNSFPNSAAVLRSHGTFPAGGNQGLRPPSGPGGVNYVEFIGGNQYLLVTFDGQDGPRWSASLLGYRSPSQSPVTSIPLTTARAGSAVEGWSGNNRIVLIAIATEWQVAAGELAHNYSASSSFSVVPFTNGAAPLYRNDDGSTAQIPLSFPFCFYGTPYSHVYINNNGNLSFEGPYWTYTPSGFPILDFAMVAPFWSDVDTRSPSSGVVYYKSEANRFTVVWDRVGYYNSHADKLNTFAVTITDGSDPIVGIGNNVAFSYGEMQWTTGDASGGAGGFGGAPATVGVNEGDGTNYALVGRFDHEGIDYDGPGGSPDGVSYLDGIQRRFDVCRGLGTIAGFKFRDVNDNCVMDEGEIGLPGWTVILNPGGRATVTDGSGSYFFSFLTPGTYTVSEVPRPNWQQTCPPSPGTHVVVLDKGQTVGGMNFGNKALADIQDLSVSVGGGPARPGFQKFYGITYQNKGTVQVNNVTVELTIPAQFTHLESSPGGVWTPANHQVIWNLGTLPAGLVGWLWTKVQVPVSIALGTAVSSVALIRPTSGDADVSNNSSKETQTIRGAFDPNEKLVTPQGVGPFGKIAVTDTLMYQINFQNVGTDTAFNIIIRDTLHPNLDIATLDIGASSHPYVFNISGSRELNWTFANINLPDSIVNEPASHGFVTFTVRPDSSTPSGTDIFNRAAIYFDFNPAVVTNTVSNRIVVCPITLTGDVDANGAVNSADIIYLVNYVFKSGSAPLPCVAAGDVNWGDTELCAPTSNAGTINSSDIIYLVNFVFRSGPSPCDVCRLVPQRWDCP